MTFYPQPFKTTETPVSHLADLGFQYVLADLHQHKEDLKYSHFIKFHTKLNSEQYTAWCKANLGTFRCSYSMDNSSDYQSIAKRKTDTEDQLIPAWCNDSHVFYNTTHDEDGVESFVSLVRTNSPTFEFEQDDNKIYYVYVHIVAASEEILRDILKKFQAIAVHAERKEDGKVLMCFWNYNTAAGDGTRIIRNIEAPVLDEIIHLYGPNEQKALLQLKDLDPSKRSESDGKIALFHGPPGTGKTTSIRALLRCWEEAKFPVSFHYVVDTEVFFSRPEYMYSVIAKDSTFWRIIIIEDCEEMLKANAKASVGQNLTRLLNLADGMLGQGAKVLFIMTSNMEIHDFHPALIRPGRCFAQNYFGPIPRAQVVELAKENGIDPSEVKGDMTLAEYGVLVNGTTAKIEAKAEEKVYATYL